MDERQAKQGQTAAIFKGLRVKALRCGPHSSGQLEVFFFSNAPLGAVSPQHESYQNDTISESQGQKQDRNPHRMRSGIVARKERECNTQSAEDEHEQPGHPGKSNHKAALAR